MQKISRHQARVWALQILFGLDIKEELSLEGARLACKKKIEEEVLDEEVRYYFQDLVEGVVLDREMIDTIINEKAIDWDVKRLAFVDRNILRLALYEIEHEIPVGVAINEAVELAKEFGDHKSSSFINGILAKSIKS